MNAGFCPKESTTPQSRRSDQDSEPSKEVNRLVEYLSEARNYSSIEAILLDGSFVTSAPEPNDIDLVVVAGPIQYTCVLNFNETLVRHSRVMCTWIRYER